MQSSSIANLGYGLLGMRHLSALSLILLLAACGGGGGSSVSSGFTNSSTVTPVTALSSSQVTMGADSSLPTSMSSSQTSASSQPQSASSKSSSLSSSVEASSSSSSQVAVINSSSSSKNASSRNSSSSTLNGKSSSSSTSSKLSSRSSSTSNSALSNSPSSTSSSNPSSSSQINQLISVIGPIEIISWSPSTAYPNLPYLYRVGVIGGQAPYTYSVVSAPAGVTIAASTGELSWITPASATGPLSIRLRVTDSLDASIEQTLSVQITSTGFYFVSPTGNDSTGTGTITNPWKTIAHALNKGVSGDTLYVRGGSYSGGFDFVGGKITRIVGYPGDAMPAIDLNHSNINPRSSRTWVEGLEIYNFSGHGFHVDGNQSDLVFRRNHMHHLYDPSQSENPSFIFFADNDYYDRVIIQDNKFHDLFDRGSGLFGDTTANYHGGASVMYNVRSALVENNEVWAIDGPCVKDKDNGQRNTFRGNNLHDCTSGAIHLSSQYTQDRIEVSWNLLSGGISIGQQPGYIRDIDIRHNTILGGLDFGCVVGDPNSVNFIIRDNIFIADNYFTYASINCKFADNTIDFSSQNKTLSSDSRFDYNLIDSSYDYVFGYGWYATNMDWVTWRSYGKDAHSKKVAAQLHNITLQDYYPKITSPACGSASDGRAIGALACVP